jgi:ribonuclease E
MKRMLINATQAEELRMAMVDGQDLYDLNIELPSGERKKANIYKGKITRIEPSLEAAFVDYGADRHGFLPFKEISSEYYVKDVAAGTKPSIRDVLKEGQDIVIQIDKEERGNKGAALTTYVSLAGRFIVLKPNKQKSGGVSRRIVGQDRDLARESLRDVDIPDGMSVILRTAGIGRDSEELEWDLNNLLAIWEAIKSVVLSRPTPFLIYRESNAIVRALRDYLNNEVGEILIDDQSAYDDAKEFVEQVMPHNMRKLKHYTDPVPLFTRYQIESQIESAFAHNVNLPSGGSIVIDHTEALVAVDINSARATKGSDIEETAFQTNLEAADEVGRQLRLRDLGGLIVIDFIDMGPQKNQRAVETRLRDAVRQDRARVQFGKISRFGLLEMSRQRLRPSLGESSNLTCPRCTGIGNIRSVESLALAILRLIGEEARKERTAKVIAQLPVEVATYLLNEKRDWVQSLETRHELQVILVANPLLETPHYQVRRVRDDQLDLPENVGTSYALIESEEEQVIPQAIQKKPTELAAVATVAATTPPPIRKETVTKGPGLWARFMSLFAGDEQKDDGKSRRGGRKPQKRSDGRSQGGQRGRRRGKGQGQSKTDGRSPQRKKQAAKKTASRSTNDGRKSQAKSADGMQDDNAARKDADDSSGNETPKKSSRRRSRGGRRRRRSSQDKSEATSQTETGQEPTAANDSQNTARNEGDSVASKPKQVQKPADMPEKQATAETREAPKERPASSSDAPKPVTPASPPAATVETTKAEKPEPAVKPVEKSEATVKPAEKPEPAAKPAEKPEPAAKPAEKPEIAAKPAGKPETAVKSAGKKAEPKAQAADYEDTQPTLPIIKQPKEEKSASKSDDTPKPAAKKKKTTTKPKADSPKGKGETEAVAAVEKKPAAEPKSDTKKPEGRLLPWEPLAVTSEQSPDKDSST